MRKTLFWLIIFLFPLVASAQGPRFKDNRDGTVTDTLTGLIWTKNANIAGKAMTHIDALEYIKELNSKKMLGYNDWRLPTIEELGSLIVKDRTGFPSVPLDRGRAPFLEASDALRGNPPNAIPKGHPFVNIAPYWYWTSTDSPE